MQSQDSLSIASLAGKAKIKRVAIIGAGMAGLQAAIDLGQFGPGQVEVLIYEANHRPGGRVYTHYFPGSSVYFEAGAMRIPPQHRGVKNLIDRVNEHFSERGQEQPIQCIRFVRSNPKARVYVNKIRSTVQRADANPESLGFGSVSNSASTLIDRVMEPHVRTLQEAAQTGNLDEAFWNLVEKFDSLTLHQYLSSEERMQRLPDACLQMARDLGAKIYLGSKVVELAKTPDGQQAIVTSINGKQITSSVFHAILLAVPPVAMRSIKRPLWSEKKEHALRALRFDPIRKIGLRFKTRWWEQPPISLQGGQSITDLPSRWIVYPSNDIGSPGEGVLLCYCWSQDAQMHLALTDGESTEQALNDIQTLHPEVDVREQFTGGSAEVSPEHVLTFNWAKTWAGGVPYFLPNQWKELYRSALHPEPASISSDVARTKKPELFYFARDHLSKHHSWIEGAIESGALAVQQMLQHRDCEPRSKLDGGRGCTIASLLCEGYRM